MPSSRCRPGDEGGFTLLELLVAITVFSILSTITYGGLKTVLDAEQQTRKHLDRLSQVQIGLNLVQRDIEQASARPIRDEFGDTLPAMRSGSLTGMLLELTHGGYVNPLDRKRSNLQRVAYLLEDNILYRLVWPALDRAQDTSPRKSILLEEVDSMEITYFDQLMEPQKEWPKPNIRNDQTTPYPLPKAIEVTLELAGMGKIRRLYRGAELAAK
ncbi:MAG: type II secretion system minor pseudopilin GspJ [Gammaproteobacteria bacterium]|nr:type II secretion system minor pseudopilin GspJ [Gammaproteobacteria bacterium]